MHDVDDLYALDLAGMRVPPALDHLALRAPRDDELALVVAWREQFLLETKLGAPGPRLRDDARSGIELLHRIGSHFLLLDGEKPVAYTAFNARLADIVQVGGVWTPPELRQRGYGRCAAAASLLQARAAGGARSASGSSGRILVFIA